MSNAADYKRYEIETAVASVVSKLSAMQRVFLIEYLVHGNATAAAAEAGYKHASQQGSRMRRNPKILAAIDEYFHAQEMAAGEVVARLSQQARAEYGEYLEYDETSGEVGVDLRRLLAEGKGHLIKSVGFAGKDADRQIVEFYDAFKALVQVGRYHGLFTDKQDVRMEGDLIQIIDVVPSTGSGNVPSTGSGGGRG